VPLATLAGSGPGRLTRLPLSVKTSRHGAELIWGGARCRLVPVAGALAIILAALQTPAVHAASPSPTPSLSEQLRQRAAEAPARSTSPVAPTSPVGARSPAAATTPSPGRLKRAGESEPFAAALAAASISATAAASPTPSLAATPTDEPTEQPSPTATPIELPTFTPSHDAVRGAVDGTRLLLEVPIRSQYDGTEYQNSNCGPTSLAMVLDAFGVSAPIYKLRNLTNVMQGNFEVEAGTSLWDLASIAEQAGLRPIGLNGAGGYRQWTVADVRDEVRRGHPVVTLVKMRDLPDHQSAASATDHYVVVVGLDEQKLLVNDPAMPAALGFRRPLTPEELELAWADSSMPRHAAAFAATSEVRELALPDPLTPSPTPTPMPTFAPGVDPNPPPQMLGRDPAPLPDGDATAAPRQDAGPASPEDASTPRPDALVQSRSGTADGAGAPAAQPVVEERGTEGAGSTVGGPAPELAAPVVEPRGLDGRAPPAAGGWLLSMLTERDIILEDGAVSPIAVDDLSGPRMHGPLFPLQPYVPRRPPWLIRPTRGVRRRRLSPSSEASAGASRPRFVGRDRGLSRRWPGLD
jgi:Peptidase_C39 like family